MIVPVAGTWAVAEGLADLDFAGYCTELADCDLTFALVAVDYDHAHYHLLLRRIAGSDLVLDYKPWSEAEIGSCYLVQSVQDCWVGAQMPV